ncbi:hypothetical protein [Gracilimonas sp. BCB1]|uniref:hypothetical protein n=1 Tax=Gracilimonas sp. BCB1 TaxID=3152362 RepID=UPI0032D90376
MKRLFFIPVFLLACTITVQAQSKVTFNVNLTPMLKDSTFVPGRDYIRVTGNLSPISTRPVRLHDSNPVDSIYTAEVRFSSRYSNSELEYNFEIVHPEGKKKTEQLPRKVRLSGRELELPPLYFNAFAW